MYQVHGKILLLIAEQPAGLVLILDYMKQPFMIIAGVHGVPQLLHLCG